LLVHPDVAANLLPKVAESLCAAGVELRADPRAYDILNNTNAATSSGNSDWKNDCKIVPAHDEDFGKEFMALILSIRVVDSLEEAIEHINAHSQGHTDVILTQDDQAAQTFIQAVDSSAVFVNASTRFNDGGQFGLGAEVAISTQKLHARGPMALRELTTYKWVATGDWLVRG
jgi:glutamate-5-semialdehyde dehydrogenase